MTDPAVLTHSLQPLCPDLAFMGQLLLAIWVDPFLTFDPCLGTGGSVLPEAPIVASQPSFRAGSLASSNSKAGKYQVFHPESGKGAGPVLLTG